MENRYGPWTMPINTGSNPQLGSFWRRRLTMLVPASQTNPALSKRNLFWLSAAGALMIVLPTLRSSSAVADDNKWATEIKEAVDSSVAADLRALTKSADGNQQPKKAGAKDTDWPSKTSYGIMLRMIDSKGLALTGPQVTLHEGQEGFMEDCSRSPFVTGLALVENVEQPHIVVLKEGTTITMAIAGPRPDGATLDVTVEQSQIGNVDTKDGVSGTNIQILNADTKIKLTLDTHKKRVIDFVKYGEVLTIPMGEKSASGTVPRIELVFGPAGKVEMPADWKSPATNPCRI